MEFLGYRLGKPPSSHADRLVWQANWERELRQNYDGGPPTSFLTFILSMQVLDAEIGIMMHEHMVRNGLIFQELFAKEAGPLFVAGHPFQTKWRALPSSTKERLILEGICRSM